MPFMLIFRRDEDIQIIFGGTLNIADVLRGIMYPSVKHQKGGMQKWIIFNNISSIKRKLQKQNLKSSTNSLKGLKPNHKNVRQKVILHGTCLKMQGDHCMCQTLFRQHKEISKYNLSVIPSFPASLKRLTPEKCFSKQPPIHLP